ncbi:MAG: hypothetical protein ACT6FG_00120 [Methanosarcinaceae archaeon]
MAWDAESAIVTGLAQGGTYINPRPTVFDDSGTLKLILGDTTGGFYGYYWNGSTWVLDSNIVTGLSGVPSFSAPTVFDDSGTWKLISGSYGTDCYGFYWSGSAWVSDLNIVSGLPTSGYSISTPHVYDDSGTFKLIMGCVHSNKFAGYYWSGSAWVLDSNIVSGITGIGSISCLCVFNDSGRLKLISGSGIKNTHGFFWNGSTWKEDNAIQYGTEFQSGEGWGSPTVFTLSSVFKLIMGFSDAGNDGFMGYTISAFDPTFTSNYDKGTNKSAYLLNKNAVQ